MVGKMFYDKIWDVYVVDMFDDGIMYLYIDLYFVYEVISL